MRRFFLPVFAVLAGGLLALAWDPVSALLAGDRVEVREAGPGAAVRLGNGASFGQAYPTEHQSPGGNPNAAQMAEMFGGRVNYSFVNGLPANSDVRADLGAVGRVDFLDEAGDLVGACTGAAISETHILTAGHCFYKDGAWRGFTEAIFQLDLLWPPNANPAVYTDYKPPLILELEIPQTEEEALAKANASRWAVKYPSGRDVGRDDLDYAVLPFRAGQWEKARARGKTPVPLAAPGLERKDELFIGHHALGFEQVLSVGGESCQISSGTDRTQFRHNCDTQEGTSGAPVFSDRYRAAVAVHVCCDLPGGGLAQNNYAVSIEAIANDNDTIVKPLVNYQPLTRDQQDSAGELQNAFSRAADFQNDGDSRMAAFVAFDALDDLWARPDADAIAEHAPPLDAILVSALDNLERLAISHAREPGLSVAEEFSVQASEKLYEQRIRLLRFSNDGSRFLVSSENGRNSVWDAVSSELISSSNEQQNYAIAAAFSADNQRLSMVANDGSVEIRDVETLEKVRELEVADEVVAIGFGADDRQIATGSKDGIVRLWDSSTGQPVFGPMVNGGEIRTIEFSSGGSALVATTISGNARLWRVPEGTPIESPDGLPALDTVSAAVFSPDAKVLATSGTDGYVRIWDASEGHLLGEQLIHGIGADVNIGGFDSGGEQLLTFTDGDVKVWNVSDGTIIGEIQDDQNIADAAFDQYSNGVLTISPFGLVKLWDVEGMMPATTFGSIDFGGPAYFKSLADWVTITPDGVRFAALLSDGTARLWDRFPGGFGPEPIVSDLDYDSLMDISPQGDRLLVRTERGVEIVDALNDAPVGEPILVDAFEPVRFSPDGSKIISRNDQSLGIWDGYTGSRSGPQIGYSTEYDAWLWFDTYANRIAVMSSQSVKLQNISTGDEIFRWPVEQDLELPTPEDAKPTVKFNSNGDRLLVLDRSGSAWLRDGKTGAEVGGRLRHKWDEAIEHAVFSPDGKMLVTAGSAGTVRLWETATGNLIIARGHNGDNSPVRFVCFSPNGDQFLSVDQKWLRIWNAKTFEIIGDGVSRTYQNEIREATYSPSGDVFLTLDTRGGLAIWESRSGRRLDQSGREDELSAYSSAQFNKAGDLILTQSSMAGVELWDARSEIRFGSANRYQTDWYSEILAFNANGDRILTSFSSWRVPPRGRALLEYARKRLAATMSPNPERCRQEDVTCSFRRLQQDSP